MTCKCYHAEKNFLGTIGMCWGTKERDPCNCEGNESQCDFYEKVRQRARVQKPQTNGDSLRAMSDYELADWITQILTYHGALYNTKTEPECDLECPLYKCCNEQPTDNIESWLKLPKE